MSKPRIWRLKRDTKISPHDYIPINKRIEWIILSVFEEKKGKATIDDILSAIFTTLRNADTPEHEEIMDVLKRLAEPKRDQEGNPYWCLRKVAPLTPFVQQPLSVQRLSDHDQVLAAIAVIGRKLEFDVWVGVQETKRNPVLTQLITIQEGLSIPGIDNEALNRIKNVDVTWLLRKQTPYALFEVEHTTDFRMGILRMSNIISYVPHLNVKLVVVLPNERLKSFENVLEEPAIIRMLKDREIYYLLYTEVAHLLDLAQKEELSREQFFKYCREKSLKEAS